MLNLNVLMSYRNTCGHALTAFKSAFWSRFKNWAITHRRLPLLHGYHNFFLELGKCNLPKITENNSPYVSGHVDVFLVMLS